MIHGYTPAQVTVSRVTGDSDDVVLTFAGTEDRITIRNTLEGSRSDTIERIEFDDGTVWTPADVRALLLTGTDGADTIRGFSTADTIAGFAGADTLWGLRGRRHAARRGRRRRAARRSRRRHAGGWRGR